MTVQHNSDDFTVLWFVVNLNIMLRHCRVTEFKYGMNLGDVVRKNFGQKLSYLSNFGEGWGMMAGLSALVFVDNHDNQRGHGAGGFSRILTFFESNMYKIANAFQLAWPYGHVRLMSSYFWPRDIQVSVWGFSFLCL